MRAWKTTAVLFYVILQLFVASGQAPSSLKLAAIVFRHGDRTPTHIIQNDPNTEDQWPEGLGQLTSIGVLQQYENGQYFRKKYDGFINQTYLHDQVYIRSTDMDRTLMSAQAMLAGLYHPPQGSQLWKPDLPWMPIPVHTEPRCQDYVYRASGSFYDEQLKHSCPLAGAQQIDQSDEMKAFLLKHQETYDYLKNHSGPGNFTAGNASGILDALICEKAHGKTWPEWATEELYNKLHFEIVPELLDIGSNKSKLSNFHKGMVVYEIAQLFKMKFNNTLDKNIRAFFFSAHDSTILALLSSLDLYASNKQVIPYCTTVMLELHHDEMNGWFVQVHFRNSTETNAMMYTLTIPGCLKDCPLPKFLNITSFYSHDNWEKKCLAPRVFRIESLKEISIIAVTSGVAVLFLALCLAFCCHRTCCRRRKRTRTYGRIRATELARPEEVPMISSNSVGSDLDE